MTQDDVNRLLGTKGFFLSSCFKIAPDIGFMASARPLARPMKTQDGASGFGQTAEAAMRQLLDHYDLEMPKDTWADFAETLERLTETVRRHA